jgi:DNA repair exonuclease SbcCD nuclease subunit
MTNEIIMMHTADWHIRDSQYGRIMRAEDFEKACMQVVELAVANKVKFIVNGGDTLHVNRNTGSVMAILYRLHYALRKAGIPMYTVTGNHDVSNPSFLTFPGAGHQDEDSGIVCIDHRTITTKDGVVISGFPAVTKEELLEGIAKLTQKPDIIVWHGAVQEFVGFEMQHALKLEEIPLDVAKAWMFGDIHLPGVRRLADGSLVSYPGPVELCDRGEPAKKKVDVYRFTLEGMRASGFEDPFPLPIKTRPVVFLQVVEEAQIDNAIAAIRRGQEEGDGRAPMVFLRYSSAVPGAVSRIAMSLDMTQSIFRAAAIPAGFDVSKTWSAKMEADGTRSVDGEHAEDSLIFGQTDPANRKKVLAGLIRSAVDAVIPPGTEINKLAHELVMPTANHRLIVANFVDRQISEPNVSV